VTAQVPPLGLAALVCTGAFCTFLLTGAVRGGTDLGFAPAGWLWLGALALVSTVVAILLFLAGLARVGPSTAAILSTLEPVVTVAGAAVVFGERLTPVQWLGGSLVLATVLIVQWPGRVAGPPVRSADGLLEHGGMVTLGQVDRTAPVEPAALPWRPATGAAL
jgi:drug/metabolite transporter (DMT)-like permease